MKILDKFQDHQDSREEMAQKYIKDYTFASALKYSII